ncbi:MAG: response regulator transcription factor [Mesorhizobium sp.]|nr:MAG: response regulator transcription factor [Mesorhizobium sp.]
MNGVDGVEASGRGRADSADRESWARRTLLFIAPDDTISESLVHAVEREFPWIGVERVRDLSATWTAFEPSVSLILIDAVFLSEIDSCSAQLARFHPAAMTAVMQDDGRRPLIPDEVFASRVVRGVLPMNLKLDVWLSVIRLMLRGGEYFPLAMFQPYLNNGMPHSEAKESKSAIKRQAALEESGQLTCRESQILEMASQGLQNKTIAAALRLSEHTVKIHMHNIINKLGAHNRTEAAALFHARRVAAAGMIPGADRPVISTLT